MQAPVCSFGLAAVTIALAACSGSAGTPLVTDGVSAVAFHAEAVALPDVKTDTGLQPANSPVQLQLTVTADAKTTIDATAHASGSSDAPVLTAKAGSGKLAIKGGFGLNARLVVDMKGLPSYDGPVPGIENSSVAFSGESTFDPYVLDGQFVAVTANIPAVNLPDIPLPGGLPGSLKIQVAEGSTVGAELRGTCAAIEGVTAQYTGTLAHSGNLVLKPTIELDIPLVGKKSYPLPDVKLPIAVPARAIDMGSMSVTFGSAPPTGTVASVGRCDGTTLPLGDASTPADAGTNDARPDAPSATDASVDGTTLPLGDASTPADAGTSDARADAPSATDASVDGAKTDASAPGTAAECTTRANGNRDSYIACCKENAQGNKEAAAIVKATICSAAVCLKECTNSYCSATSTPADTACDNCFTLSSTQASLDSAFDTQCTSESCRRYKTCVNSAPANP
jgi:hypothetical protein